MAWPPARLLHGDPRLDGLMPKHPSPGQRNRWAGRNPAVGPHRHPFGMNGGCVWLELHHLLLLSIHKPPLAARLGGAVLVAKAFLGNVDTLRKGYSAPRKRLPQADLRRILAFILIVETESTAVPTGFLNFSGLRVAFSGLLDWRIRYGE